MGKLDTVTVNGPEDDVWDWDAVEWSQGVILSIGHLPPTVGHAIPLH
jgi:hypothetical protein